MLNFFNDIGDVADCLEIYSDCDNVQSQLTYSYNHHQYVYEIEEVNALVCALGITETNMHVLSKNPADKKRMYTMQKPQYFEHIQNLRLNKQILRECAKESQLVAGELLSEDLLIRSQQEAIKNIVPYLNQM